MNINLHKLNYYIAGMFDGEGSFNTVTLSISNTNLNLLKIIHRHLLKIGIKNKVFKRKGDLKNKHYLQAYDIKIFGRKNLDKFYTYIPFFHRNKRKKLLEYLKRTQSTISFKKLKQMKKDKRNGLSYRKIAKKRNKSHNATYDYIIGKRKPNY